MSESIQERVVRLPDQRSVREMKPLLDAVNTDLATLFAYVASLRTAINTLTAKIDADAGDTGGDSNYAASVVVAAVGTQTLTT